MEAQRDHLRRQGYSPATIDCLENLVSAFYRLSGLSPRSALVDVTHSVAERVMRRLAAKYAPGTAWAYSTKLLALFRSFVAAGLLLENPFAQIDPFRKPRLLPKPSLSRETMKKLLATPRLDLPSGVRNRALLEVLYSTGIRLSECARLEVGDLDFAQGALRVRCGKGGKDRMVPLGNEAIRWTRRYLARVRPRFAPAGELALWVGQSGQPIQPLWIQLTLRRLGRRAQIAIPVTPHTLRRTCASHLLRGGASAWAVKEILGHSDSKTLSRYLSVPLRDLKEAHEKTHPRP